MFCITVSISATGFGYLEVDLGLIVGSYWIHCFSLAMELSTFHNLNVNATGM